MAAKLRIDCRFPGGNIIVEKIDGDDVYIRQDMRDTTIWWFYWYFRVRGAAGRRLRFHFIDGDPIGARGPAVSRDGGTTWRWLGKKVVKGPSFSYAFGQAEQETRFCFGIPYVDANLEEFLARRSGSPYLKAETLCRSRKGRPVPCLRLGRLDGEAACRAVLTARHHCCEMMASYALEGIMDAVLSRSEDGRWLRENVEFMVVPFVDTDGVEDGDQGKARRPHDHGRDYGARSIYPETRTIKRLVPRWSAGRPCVTMDLHCPYMRGHYNEFVYFAGGPNQESWREVGRFARILESLQRGPLVFHAKNNLPFGQAWNTGDPRKGLKGFIGWSEALEEVRMAAALEIPYANAEGKAVTARSARLLGKDLARALRRYLQNVIDGR